MTLGEATVVALVAYLAAIVGVLLYDAIKDRSRSDQG